MLVGEECLDIYKEYTYRYKDSVEYWSLQILELDYKTSKNSVDRVLWNMLVLSYFSQLVLEDVQNFVSVNEVHWVIT